jgi:outer membrane protein TolC
VVDRGDVEAALLGSAAVTPVRLTTALKTYRALTPAQCAALAAHAAHLANLYQLEAQTAPERSHPPSRARRTRQTILNLVALEARNRAAAAALEAYYDLARAEAGDDLASQGLDAVRDAVRKTEDILKGKLRPAVELDVWQRHRYRLQTDRVQAHNQVEQANTRLRGLMGFSGSPNAIYFWPQLDAAGPPEVVDVEGAVVLALGQRPELRLLRCLVHDLDVDTLTAVRPLLQTVSPLLGNRPAADYPCLAVLRAVMPGGPVREREVTIRRQQLLELLKERERAAANEARQAAHDLNAHRRLADLARQQAKNGQDKLDDLERRGAKGLASFADITAARLEWLKARGEVVAELVAVRVADVRLRQAQSFWGLKGCASAGPVLPPSPPLLPDTDRPADAVRLPEIVLPAPAGR